MSTPGQEDSFSEERAVSYLFAAFNSRDVEAGLSLLHPEIVFETVSGTVVNDGKPYRGHAGMRQYFADVQKHWHELQVNPVQIRSAGGAVVALGQVSGVGGAGALQAEPATWIFKFKDRLVCSIQIFSDERQAKRALSGD
ncbi:MAG TPA: nuclear transport factor 2 family protein [Solirubrobacteraceae bacterium]